MDSMQRERGVVDPPGRLQPKVVHCMSGEHYDLYCGRGKCPRTHKPGEWGNRYTHRKSKFSDLVVVPSAAEAVRLHKLEFWELICSGAIPLDKLAALHGSVFGCWCWEPPCHAYTIAAGAAWAAAQLGRAA
jgi:hypothetical protein